MLASESDNFCSASDNNLVQASMPYYGVIEDIWELGYCEFRVAIFKCLWVNGNTGVRQDKMGFTLVDLQKVAYNVDPFNMVVQARQMFYVQDPCDSRWPVVLQGRTICIGDRIDGSTLDVSEMPTFSKQMPLINAEDDEDDVHPTRNNHDEGL